MSDDRKQDKKNRSAQRRTRYREIAAVLWEGRLFDIFRGTVLRYPFLKILYRCSITYMVLSLQGIPIRSDLLLMDSF